MRLPTKMSLALLACLTTGALLYGAEAPTTAPAAENSTTPPAEANATTQPVITKEARAQLDQIDSAYKQLKALDLTGKLTLRFDVQGQKQSKDTEFTSSYEAPNKFKQDVKGDITAGSTGKKLYLYSKDHNVYLMQDAPKGKIDPGKMPDPYSQVIGTQNPSLMLALSSSPTKSLTNNLGSAELLPDVMVDGKTLKALKLSDPQTQANLTLLVDPDTHLVRRATLDMSKALEKRGATDVKEARVTVDYSSITPNPPVKKNEFAWTPPANAKDAAKEQAAAAKNDEPAMALVGKPAPDFTAKNLDDKDVSLKDQKGHVVIVDFWATWCPPCREGLPHVDKVYQEFKDKGVEAFAMNVQEPKQKVKQFVTDQKFHFTTLLDSDGKISQAYDVTGIPQTMVIGRDGIVKNVFIGTGPNSEQQLHDAVEAAVKAK